MAVEVGDLAPDKVKSPAAMACSGLKAMPTVLITVSPEASHQMRPPRAFYPRGFKIGNALGRPFMPDLQKRVLHDVLLLLKEPPRPGEIIEREYPEYAAGE